MYLFVYVGVERIWVTTLFSIQQPLSNGMVILVILLHIKALMLQTAALYTKLDGTLPLNMGHHLFCFLGMIREQHNMSLPY